MEGKKTACPFCEGDKDGCCFCDHTGQVEIGEGQVFKNEQQMKNSIGVKFLKEMDAKGGTETWGEMIEYFLDDKNVPKWYAQK